MSGAIRRPRGRPRDRGIDQRIVEATLNVVAERGIGGAAMDEIALRSGVSKATIYQRWPSKEALCVDAVGQAEPEITAEQSENPRADCIHFLTELYGSGMSERAALLLPRILAETSSNAGLARVFQERVIYPRRAQCAHIVEQAVGRQQLAAHTDVQFAVDMLLGPIFYRRLIRNVSRPDPGFPTRIVDAVWTAFAAHS